VKLGALEIGIPESWEDRSLYTFIAPAAKASLGATVKGGQSEFRTNVVIAPSPLAEGDDLAACAKKATDRAKKDFGANLEVTVEEGPRASGRETKRLRWRVVDPRGGAPIQQIQYILTARDRQWTITFSTLAVEARAQLSDLDEYVRSVRVDEK
jgi:hypothetical protein